MKQKFAIYKLSAIKFIVLFKRELYTHPDGAVLTVFSSLPLWISFATIPTNNVIVVSRITTSKML